MARTERREQQAARHYGRRNAGAPRQRYDNLAAEMAAEGEDDIEFIDDDDIEDIDDIEELDDFDYEEDDNE